jgi:hypothetical protein
MTFSKPSAFPVWASLDQVDPVSQQNNVLTPPPEKQMYGWSRLEFPPRNWFNWLARFTNNWLQYLAQQESQSVVTGDVSGATAIVDPINGGMAIVSIIDTGAPANYFQGITYIPPSYAGGTSFTTTSTSSTSTTTSISTS